MQKAEAIPYRIAYGGQIMPFKKNIISLRAGFRLFYRESEFPPTIGSVTHNEMESGYPGRHVNDATYVVPLQSKIKLLIAPDPTHDILRFTRPAFNAIAPERDEIVSVPVVVTRTNIDIRVSPRIFRNRNLNIGL